jgi:hypothetical protein
MCVFIVKELLEIWSPAFGFISYKLKSNVLLFLGLGNCFKLYSRSLNIFDYITMLLKRSSKSWLCVSGLGSPFWAPFPCYLICCPMWNICNDYITKSSLHGSKVTLNFLNTWGTSSCRSCIMKMKWVTDGKILIFDLFATGHIIHRDSCNRILAIHWTPESLGRKKWWVFPIDL